jgi:iron complex outermembrane receptor protein
VGASSNSNPQSIQDSYALVNARAGIRAADGDWDITVFGYNLTDEDYCQTMFDQALGGPVGALDRQNNTMVQRCALGSPETWNVRASYRF